jgi:tetratricopeptide (TPR) repeat protein
LSELNPKSINASEDLARFYQEGESCLVRAKLWSAGDYFANALKGFRQVSDSAGMARCLLKLGRVLELLGEYNKAVTTYTESLNIYLRSNDPLGVARSKAFLGNVFWAKGDYANAKMLLEEARKYFKEEEYLPGQAWVNDLMGNLHLAEGKDMEAESCYGAAFVMARKVGESPEGLAWNEYHLAAVKLFRGQWAPARDGFLKALKIFTEIGDVLGQVATLIHLGEVYCEEKDFTEAEKYTLRSIKLVVPTQCKPLLADALTGLARLMKGKGEDSEAISILTSAISDPTCRQQTKDHMVSLSELLESHFSKKEIDAGLRWAKDYTLEEMASSWLKAVSSKPKSKKKKQK